MCFSHLGFSNRDFFQQTLKRWTFLLEKSATEKTRSGGIVPSHKSSVCQAMSPGNVSKNIPR